MSHKLRLTLFVVLVILAALYILGPRMVAVVWHLRYGNQLHQLGATTVVPGRWFALDNKGSQSLFTITPSWSRKIFDFDSITFTPLPSVEARAPPKSMNAGRQAYLTPTLFGSIEC